MITLYLYFLAINPMKHFLTIALLLITFSINGQIFKNIGVKTGVNFSKYKFEYTWDSHTPGHEEELDNPPGFNIALAADLIDEQYWDINTAFGIIRKKGEDITWTSPNNDPHSFIYNLDYLSFINVIRGKLPIMDYFSIYLSAGPRIDYLYNYSDNAQYFGKFMQLYPEEDFNEIVFGLNAGIGILLDLRKIKMGLEFSRNINFYPIISASGPRPDGFGDEGTELIVRDRTSIINFHISYKLKTIANNGEHP
jgi:hypothetical protein